MAEPHNDSENFWLIVFIAISGIAIIIDEAADSFWLKVLKIGGMIVSLLLSIYRFRSYKPFVRHISSGDWVPFDEGFQHQIPESEHCRGSTPSIRCECRDGDDYSQCLTAVATDATGSIRLATNKPFDARITIRR